jgi:hypothetical protein
VVVEAIWQQQQQQQQQQQFSWICLRFLDTQEEGLLGQDCDSGSIN